MSTLRIFNVSDYIHAGAAPRKDIPITLIPSYYAGVGELPDGRYAARGFPTGGISFMLNPIIETLVREETKDDIMVFCVDSTPTIKRELYYKALKFEIGYKGTRPKKSIDLSIQRDAIKDILMLISPNVIYAEGYEADDTIAALVWKYRNSFDKILVHNTDQDLYFLVDDKVEMMPVGKRGKHVTKNNFSSVVRCKDKSPMEYNCVLLDKLIYGDTSDNIPGIGELYGNQIKKLITPDKYKFLTNPNIFKSWVGKAVNYDEAVMGIVDLLVPLNVPNDILEIYEEPIDMSKLCYLGNKVGNKYCRENEFLNDFDVKAQAVIEVLDYYADEYCMRGGRFNG